MRRGDIVIVAARGDYGKPRPAVIVQSDALPEDHASVMLCQMTSAVIDSAYLRVTVEPDSTNGLRSRSQIMVDKLVTLRRERVGETIGRLGEGETRRLDVALAFVLGLAG